MKRMWAAFALVSFVACGVVPARAQSGSIPIHQAMKALSPPLGGMWWFEEKLSADKHPRYLPATVMNFVEFLILIDQERRVAFGLLMPPRQPQQYAGILYANGREGWEQTSAFEIVSVEAMPPGASPTGEALKFELHFLDAAGKRTKAKWVR
jgi:hypothetical protein